MRTLALCLLLAALPGCSDEVIGYRTSVTDGFADDPLPPFAAGGLDLRRVVSFDDGRSWEAESVDPSPPMDAYVSGIARSPERIVMVAGETTLVSDDGEQWESFNDFQGFMNGVAYGNGVFVSVGYGGRRTYSPDGWGWINRPDPDEGAFYQAIAFGDGRFVAVGEARMATSTDGQSWTETAIETGKLHAIAYGDGRFVAVSEEGDVVITRDGRSLEHNALGPYIDDVCFFDGRWVGVAGGVVHVSDDGIDWAQFAHDHIIYSLGCGPTSMVGAGDDRLFRAEDPSVWEPTATVDGPLTTVRYTGS